MSRSYGEYRVPFLSAHVFWVTMQFKNFLRSPYSSGHIITGTPCTCTYRPSPLRCILSYIN